MAGIRAEEVNRLREVRAYADENPRQEQALNGWRHSVCGAIPLRIPSNGHICDRCAGLFPVGHTEVTFWRIAIDQPCLVDVRVVAATNKVPDDAILAGQLREDLDFEGACALFHACRSCN